MTTKVSSKTRANSDHMVMAREHVTSLRAKLVVTAK